MKAKIISLLFVLLFLGGCSFQNPNTNINLNDGVLRLENGTSVLGTYNDYPTMTHNEKELFLGNSYIFTDAGTITNASPLTYYLCSGNDRRIHLETFNVNIDGTPFEINLYEDPTVLLLGTQEVARNLERNFPDNHSLNISANTTFASLGTLLWSAEVYGGNNVQGELIIPTTMILELGECYVLELDNNDGVSVNFNINLLWYEMS